MKRVLRNNGEVCHVWAHQTQPEGRAGHVFFRDAVIYSYGRHFPMGRIVDTNRGKVALITTATYSVTTAHHVSQCRGAVRHMTSFSVPDIMADTHEAYEANWKDIMDRCFDTVESARHSREGIEGLLWAATGLENKANGYAVAFGLKKKSTGAYVANATASLQEEIQRGRELCKIREDAHRVRRAEWNRQAALTLSERLVEWRAGTCTGTMMLPDGTDVLRIAAPDGGEAELVTGQGARVHLREAVILFKLWQRAREPGAVAPELPDRIGPYDGIGLESLDVMTIGCHRFSWTEAVQVLGGVA